MLTNYKQFWVYLLFILFVSSTNVYSQTISISSPVANDTLNYGSSKTITWNWTGANGTAKIEYSTNGGTSWININSNVTNNNGSNTYNWSVPNNPSNNCRIRITSIDYPAISQISGLFVIRSLVLLSPSSGNHIQAGKTFNIQWTSSYVSSLRLEYSTDNGNNWNLIQTGVNPTASPYVWNVPDIVSDQAIVRVSDATKSITNTNCIKSQSGSFYICKLRLLAPNGGEFLFSNSNYNIQWTASNNVSFVNLEYSTDNGGNWYTIANNLSASSGSYTWMVTNNTSNNQALIRVSDASYPNYVNDISDNNFTIGRLLVTSPNGGLAAGYLSGSTITITWSSQNISLVNIYYTIDGTSYTPIVTNYDATNGFYNWTIPAGINTNKFKIKIEDASNSSRYDESDYYSVISTISLSSISANIQTGKTITLNWAAGSYLSNVNISYSTDNGNSFPYTIATNISASTGTYNWVVPSGITGDNCKIKITSTQYPDIYAISNTFKIAELNLTYPLGTDGWIAGGTYTIMWNKSTNVANVKVYISTNNGNTWGSPLTTTSSNSYVYTVNSGFDFNQFKVKVEDATTTDIYSETPIGFKVGKINILSPSTSGEVWNSGTVKTISWTATTFINIVRLEYSTNGGLDWTFIANVGATVGSYNWTVPSVSSNNCVIRISDSDVPTIFATSNTFSIGNLIVTYPDGGEGLNANSNVNIQWTANGIANVNIYYSLNNGANWIKIASNINAASGSYTWLLPDVVSSQCLVRVSDANDTTYYDNSNGAFRIGKISIIQPTTNKINQGSVYTIKWNATSNISNVNIYYSENNGASWNLIQNNVNASLGQYNWNVPFTTTSQGKIRIEDAQTNSLITATNSGNFSISYITVNTPNGGENWFSTSTQNITWTSSADVSNVKIYVSTDGVTFGSTPIYNGPNTGSYSWVVDGNYISTTARIKIVDASASNVSDSSNNVFTITPLQLTAPNNPITLYQGQSYNITYDYDATKVSSVKIEFSSTGGNSWTNIVASIPATGVYNWTVPAVTTNNGLIRITSNDNPAFYDVSDNTFSINTISLTSPNGNENWMAGTTKNITWVNIPGVSALNLYYSLDGGNSWRLFKTGINAGAQTYSWVVPDSASNMVRIKIAASDNPAISDISDNNFTISSLTLLSPLGGEKLLAGQQHYITWDAQYIQSVKIELTTNGGSTWISPEIATGVPGANGTYLWTIPNNPTTQARIRITSDNPNDNTITKTSPANFTISRLQITNPISTTAFQEGQTATIQWTADNIDFVNIDISTNGGIEWNNIATGYPALGGSYNWTVPINYSSNNCIIRIYDQSNFVRIATSQTFNISKLNITSPTTSDKWFIGSTKKIQWQSTNVSLVNILYSTDGGATWPITIASNYPANAGYYDWQVSGLVTTQGRIRIVSVDKPSITATTGNFQTSSLNITQPAGNESWQVGTNKSINWTYGNITSVYLYYSTDGSNWLQIGAGPINAALQTYNWTIPDISSNTVRIKIADAADTSRNAVSNPFKIGKITVLYPNGNEILQSGKTINITWNNYSSISNVKIEYSTNAGGSWNTIVNSVQANLGAYPWVIPNTTGNSYRIRISDADSPSPTEFINDISDNNFTVKRIDLISPVSGEYFQIGKTKQISWNVGNIATLRIDLSTNGGSDFFNIAEISGANTSYNLKLTNPAYVSTACYLRIYDKDNPTIVSELSSPFTIKRLDLISPNGGEIKQAGVVDTIKWQASGVSNITLQYSTDGGLNFSNSIVNNHPANLGYYYWTIPSNLYGNNIKVRIVDYDVSSISDTSDNNFSISQLAITQPTSTSKFNVGLPLIVNWSANNLTQINIDLSTDGGLSYPYNIVSNYNATLNTCTWVIPLTLTPSSNCVIKITDANNPTTYILSQQFSIAKLKILVPNDGTQNWQTVTQQTITWQASSNVSNIRIEYTSNNGVSWNTIINSVPATTGNYLWTIPNTAASNLVKIRITDVSNNNVIDSSDNNFNIRRLDLTSPNGGESFAAGSSQQISWIANNVNNVKIEYQTSNGGTWTHIATVPANSSPYTWTVPATTSSEYRIRISDATYSTIQSQSANTFKVGQITVTRPNTAETFQVGKTLPIRWNASSNINFVNIAFSTDNGTTWYYIANNVSASAGAYNWTILNKPSNNCLIRITDASTDTTVSGHIRDISDVAFSVKYLKLNIPNGGETWKIGSNQNITWETSSNISNIHIYLSTNSGNSWGITLGNNVGAGAGSFLWSNIGNYPYSTCKVKIIDASNNSISDSSDNAFKIGNISIIEPVALANYKTNSPMVIKWTSTSNINTVNIYYSADGVSWNQQIASNLPSTTGTNEFTWVTPLTATNTAKIKIVDAESGSTIEEISSTFRITDLNIISPVSTDKWQVGTSKNIIWSGQGVSNVNISILDNSNISYSIATNTNLTTYNWSIPDIPFFQAPSYRIVVTDASNPDNSDTSEIFTICKVKVDSPNGGENIYAGSTYTINWTTYNVTNVKIEYSSNNGTSWNTIVGNIASNNGSNSYNWLVPNDTSSNYRIRVSDFSNSTINDISDNRFTVSKITVLSPNGGENWQIGTTKTITWRSNGISQVNIYLNYGAGNFTIATNVSSVGGSGSYNWAIPDNPLLYTTNAKIIISSSTDPTKADTSDNVFTISKLVVISPNGSENWFKNSISTISWESRNISSVKIEYSTDNGINWKNIATVTSVNGINNYNWLVPADTSLNCIVRISNATNSTIYDVSDNKFNILGLFITQPIANAKWRNGLLKTISWRANYSTNVNIYILTPTGKSLIASNVTGNSWGGNYTWSILDSNKYYTNSNRIIIEDFGDPSRCDTTNYSFSISKLQITTPNTNVNWFAGSSKIISWVSQNISNVVIEYSSNNGGSWSTITTTTSNNGTNNYSWTVPSTASSQCLIRIKDVADGNLLSDTSNTTFTISNLQLLSPLSNARWQMGKVNTIQWTASNIANVKIEYYDIATANWLTIATVSASSGAYNWLIPALGLTPSDQYKIRISAADDPTKMVESGLFTIGNVQLSNFNGGEVVQAGKVVTINWTKTSFVNTVNLKYTTNNGTDWNTIASGISITSYNWNIPNISSNNVKILVEDAVANSLIKDTSDAVFTIARLVVNVPNNGEVYREGTKINITWTAQNTNNLRLEYSIDHSNSWNIIANSVNPASGSYTWTLPYGLVSKYLTIKAYDVSYPTIMDTTDNKVTVAKLLITNPAGGETWVANDTKSISWNSQYIPASTYTIEYTTDNGVNWQTIVTNVPTSNNNYNWVLPSTALSNVKIRIRHNDNSNLSDTLDGTFTIVAPKITVTQPNGGEILLKDQPYTIQYTRTPDTTNVNIYSRLEGKKGWRLLAGNTTALSYNWTPDTAGNYKIIIVDFNNPNVVGDSSDAFCTVKHIQVTQPAGGEIWQAGKPYQIKWVTSNNINTVRIEYSTNAGGSWLPITSSIPAADQQYNWTIPYALDGKQVHIKVSDELASSVIYDISDGFATISNLQVVYPNSNTDGLVEGKSYNIQWTNSPSITNIDIYYTADGGPLQTIQANVPAAGGQYNWTVPAINSDNVKIVIKDASNPLIVDSSDNAFKVASLMVVTPNGGEDFRIGRNATITWFNSSNISAVNIYYSLNNGTTWFIAGVNVPSTNSVNNYTWKVPNVLSTTNALIKIIDASNSNIEDIGDANFTISNLVVTSPNGGERISAGKKYNITWIAQNVTTNLRIQYTLNGTNWQDIATVPGTTTNYEWNVAADTSTVNAKIRIMDPTLTEGDTSDANFTIGYIKILNPIAGNVYQTNRNIQIYWQDSPNIGSVNIKYQVGTSVPVTIVSNYASPTNLYNWTVPLDLAHNNLNLIISDINADVTLADTIKINTVKLQLTSLNGGQKILANKVTPITWASSNLTGTIKIELSTDDGFNWIAIPGASNVSAADGVFNWLVNNITTGQNRIRIISNNDNSIRDSSASFFIISRLKVTDPTSIANYKAGTTQNLKWDNSSNIGNINIYFSSNNGSTWTNLFNNVSTTGQNKNWVVPYTTSNQCRIRIEDAQYPTNADTSEAFSVYTPTITVTAPNLPSRILVGKTYNITWNSQFVTNFKIELSTNGGVDWNPIVLSTTGNNYNWTIPQPFDTVTSNNCLIKISDASDNSIFDVSDNPFTISSLKFISPVGGEIVQVGKHFTIRWNSSQIDRVRIDYFDGTSWTQIINNISASTGNYVWTVPNIFSSAIKFRLYDADNLSNYIESNTISTADIAVIYPVGGEVIQTGQTVKIKWNYQNISNVKLEYSLENGAEGTWNTIVNSVPATTGSTGYNWTIDTSLSSRDCLIRISEVGNSNVFATSYSTFKIGNIVVLSPNGGEVFKSGQSYTIRWYNKPSTSSVKLYYSTNNGTN
ncbi:MAG TPA: hypothetical protein PK591_10105, partial [Ignavibacteriales bacterium]|nr:hypothetical protein [Ignavibacteriales bacterium]